ncbi:MAG: pyridoxine 5'-phosphate synthase [Gammaproteobacteria bacterium]|nr:pyridoxine 5'-phosphate synthase [Gammaproteobacteria bacterium]MCZ6668204.1 pyridoxine 5'-phosphate synthase [Gammaproteobacteria bacterium]MCZ6723906.1 pyridoxine 5'-phosphate synthase [Gammaproteobacteria bacterium]
MNNPVTLGVNIDHVATLRQARGTRYPDPVFAAQIAEQSGADSITFHLREDLRHIQKRDALLLKQVVQTKLNLEMAVIPEMLEFACEFKAEDVCLVPEKREELTTEGGLDVAGQFPQLREACELLAAAGTRVSPFIDASFEQIDAVIECGAPCVEIHTGHYADARGAEQLALLEKLIESISYAYEKGLQVNAGHGLNYHNVQAIAAIPQLSELNIGHAIIADAVFNGLANSIREMKRLIVEARI